MTTKEKNRMRRHTDWEQEQEGATKKTKNLEGLSDIQLTQISLFGPCGCIRGRNVFNWTSYPITSGKLRDKVTPIMSGKLKQSFSYARCHGNAHIDKNPISSQKT